jgi:hypothetical protein
MPRVTARNSAAAVTGLMVGALVCAPPAWALHMPAVHMPSLHWPWKHRAAAQPPSVQELAITLQGSAGPAGAIAGAASVEHASTQPVAIQQYWDRNALLLDLTQVSGDGSATLAPVAGGAWPVRLEFRVHPGGFARLEVSGAQRLIFTVPTQGDSMVLKLDPGVYQFDSENVTLRWSAAADLPH